METDKLFTVAEVCFYYKISQSTLYRMINEKKIIPVKVGRSIRFTQSELEKLKK